MTTMTVSNNLLADDSNMQYILGMLDQANDIAVDTETSGLNVRNNVDYLMGVCVDAPGVSAYIPFRHKDQNVDRRYLAPLVQILQQKSLIWHNRKFDYHSFKTIGVDPLSFRGKSYCTLLIAMLVNEELYSKELDQLAKVFLKSSKFEKDRVHGYAQRVGYANVPAAMYKDYGAEDAVLTRRLRDVLWPKLVAQELEGVYWETESPFNNLLYVLEQRGVGTNPSFCEQKSDRGRGRMATLRRELGFNPGSNPELGSVLVDKLGLPVLQHTASCQACKEGHEVNTHTGRASFNKVVMNEYEDILSAQDNNPVARHITEYRGWQKAVTSLYEPTLEKVGPDGRIRTQFKQHGTVTGRLSSSDPNLQQVPRSTAKVWNGDAKSAFNAGQEDYLLYGWDWSQVELRLAAAYGREHVLLDEFSQDDADPFRVLAPLIFGVYSDEFRHKTKNGFVYPSLYGAGLVKVAASVGLTVSDTRPLYERYKQSIPGITKVSQQVQQVVEKRGYVKYWDGRRRHFRNRKDAFKAWNSVLQGGSAQLMKQTMLKCAKFDNPECELRLTVHDEITFAVHENMVAKYDPLVREAMCDWNFGVRLNCDGKEWR